MATRIFLEFNTEDTEKSHRERREICADQVLETMARERLVSLRTSEIFGVLCVELWGIDRRGNKAKYSS